MIGIVHKCVRVLTMGALVFAGGFAPNRASAAETMSFTEDIVPILQIRCLECHQPGAEGYQKSGLDLSSYEGIMKGTKFGPMVVPGNAFMSNLMVMIDGRTAAAARMPHGKKRLSSCEIRLFRLWINQGAHDN